VLRWLDRWISQHALFESDSVKLLYVINSLGQGGAERSLVELLPFYRAAGIEPTIACLRSMSHYAEEVRAQGYALRFLSSRTLRGWIPELRRLIGDEQPDLVHTTIFESNIAGRVAALGTGVPVLTSLVNLAYEPVQARDPNVSPFSFAAVRTLDGTTARWMTSHFHAITEAVKASAVRTLRLKPERITVIPRGRDTIRLGKPGAERRQRSRAALGIAPDAPLVVNVARQEYQKGQEHLIEAMRTVVCHYPAARLLIAGREGHATPLLLRKREELGIGDHVRFLGYRSDIPDVLAAADVFAFPSLYEGLGGAVLEAMALELPVVASDLLALREVVENGESAYLVPSADPVTIATRIIELLGDPARARAMGRRGRSIFEEKFTVERSAERMIELYRSLRRAG
jgi:glycosyltransferase involved in cell wall biosynthesis